MTAAPAAALASRDENTRGRSDRNARSGWRVDPAADGAIGGGNAFHGLRITVDHGAKTVAFER